jgi:hypothetical protein
VTGELRALKEAENLAKQTRGSNHRELRWVEVEALDTVSLSPSGVPFTIFVTAVLDGRVPKRLREPGLIPSQQPLSWTAVSLNPAHLVAARRGPPYWAHCQLRWALSRCDRAIPSWFMVILREAVLVIAPHRPRSGSLNRSPTGPPKCRRTTPIARWPVTVEESHTRRRRRHWPGFCFGEMSSRQSSGSWTR